MLVSLSAESLFDHFIKPGTKDTSGGQVIALSGCDDTQESADTNAFGDHRSKQGAMTYALIHALDLGMANSYFELVTTMRALLQRTLQPEDAESTGGLEDKETELRKLHDYVRRQLQNPKAVTVQVPQLTSSKPLNLHEPFTLGFNSAHHSDHPHARHISSDSLKAYKDQHQDQITKIKEGNLW